MDNVIVDSLLDAAIKAPSGHNVQPWLFSELPGDGILVEPDVSRRLPVLDPQDRELYISVGCTVENMCVAATRFGLSAEVRVRGDGSGVEVFFKCDGNVVPSLLVQAIERRHTNRNKYDGTEIPRSVIDLLSVCGADIYMRGSMQFEVVKNGIIEADKVIYGNSRSKDELLEWIRYNRRESDNFMDGLGNDVLGIPDMPAWVSRIATSLALRASIQSRGDIRKLMSSPAVAAFYAPDDIAGRIQCGRNLQRFLLTATMHDVACAFIGQPCEVESVATGLASHLDLPCRLQVLLRIGHSAPPLAYSRRRPLAEFKKFKSVT